MTGERQILCFSILVENKTVLICKPPVLRTHVLKINILSEENLLLAGHPSNFVLYAKMKLQQWLM